MIEIIESFRRLYRRLKWWNLNRGGTTVSSQWLHEHKSDAIH